MAACPHRPPCPGCPRFGEPGIAPGAYRALAALARTHGIELIPTVSGPCHGFRQRARLAIRGRQGSPKIGLFELETHRVVHIPHCVVHHPLINHVASIVRRALAETRATCYSDRAHLGVARYLQVVVEQSSQSAQVVLVANDATPAALADCLALIRERLGADLHSLWFNANCDRSNVILGPAFERLHGPDSVVERFGGAAVHYPPGAFGQANLAAAAQIIEQVRADIPPGARVTEFYAGVGAIGLSVLARTSALSMNEVAPQSLRGLELGLEQLDPTDRAKVRILAGEAGAQVAAATGADVVIADPPRKGLDPQLVAYLADVPPERLIYISCGLESFLADAARLTATGRLRLAALTAYNLMPYTEHVETVARFERA